MCNKQFNITIIVWTHEKRLLEKGKNGNFVNDSGRQNKIIILMYEHIIIGCLKKVKTVIL